MTYRRYVVIAGRQVPRAVAMVERVLGKPLPAGAIVHHADGDETNDDQRNLVVCPSKAYHNLIHARMRALAACGSADWIMCGICKQYDAPENLYVRNKDGRRANYRACHAAKETERYRKKNGQIPDRQPQA